jgi:putative ABC transport system permease protein
MIALFDRDSWREIVLTLDKNRLRTALTAFGVFWGIFMLVLLIGGGQGLKAGALYEYDGFSTNSLTLNPERTTISFKGLPPNRRYIFTTEDMAAVRESVKGIKRLVPQISWWPVLTRGTQRLSAQVVGTHPGLLGIDQFDMTSGRFISHLDLEQKRKNVVIGKDVFLRLFKRDENPVGRYIRINGVEYLVTGVFKSRSAGNQADFENNCVYMPLTTLQQVCGVGNRIWFLSVEAEEGHSATRVGEAIKTLLKERHQIAPADSLAIGERNREMEYRKLNYLHGAIAALIWVIGVGTLLSGVIGVSNIMLFSVKARTHEIGVRRVLGATPGAVITQILMESFLLTSVAGMFGLTLGVLVLSRLHGIEAPSFRNPDGSAGAALSALGIIVLSGVAAGLLPAYRAVSLKPIEAIRDYS